MSDEQPEGEDFVYKTEFAMRHGISARTVDLWVRAGKVERIVDPLDRRALFRLVTPGSPVTRPDAPEWAREMLEEIRALRAEVAALRGAQAEARPGVNLIGPLPPYDPASGGAPSVDAPPVTAQLGSGDGAVTPPAQPDPPPPAAARNPVARPAWWRRLLSGGG